MRTQILDTKGFAVAVGAGGVHPHVALPPLESGCCDLAVVVRERVCEAPD